MAQIFLSYAREDSQKARIIAQAMERAGHFVWWDLHVRGGDQFSKVIEEALKAADSVVVLWTAHSVDSPWVRDEAAAGRDRGRLVPVTLDGTQAPIGFRQFQAIDLSRWGGRGKSAQLRILDEAVRSVTASGAKPVASTIPMRPARGFWDVLLARPWLVVSMLVGVALVGLGLFISKPWEHRSNGVYMVGVSAADASANPLARDLLVNLGRLQSATSGAVRLVEITSHETNPARPDLIFEAASDDDPNQVGSSLVLMDGGDRSILWSKDFEQPSGKLADLKQQVAFTAARVLDCTLEGLNSHVQLKQQTLKEYLTACSQSDELAGSDPRPLIPVLRKVIAEAPRFEPAWATLLLVQAELTEVDFVDGRRQVIGGRELMRSIASARKLNPEMAEATIAEISLIPIGDFAQTLRLADQAVREAPDKPVTLNNRSSLLRRVGRMRDSIDDARHAASLDPLSPYTRNAYISALFYAGRFEAARQELTKAEQLWPGTGTVNEVKFRFHLRYGDPKEALRIAQSGGQEHGTELFLNARIDPSAENLSALRAFIEERAPVMGAFGLSFALQTGGEFGWEDYLYKLLLNGPSTEDLQGVADVYFRPTLRKFRADPRFMIIAKRTGLVDYWRTSGEWPDFCQEPGLPYDCKAEAAKLG